MRNQRPPHLRIKKKLLIRVTALLTAFSLCADPGNLYAQMPPRDAAPSAETALLFPDNLGHVEESFQGSSGKTILFIQDAHDSLEAQKNIAELITAFTEKDGVKTVFEEGYEGPVPTEKFFGFIQDPEIRLKVTSFLLDKLRIGGAEYAHINRKADFRLVGADNLSVYRENIQAFREAAKKNAAIRSDLETITTEIESLAGRHFPKPFREWLDVHDRFENGQLDLLSYLQRGWALAAKTESPGASEKFLPKIALLLGAQASNDAAMSAEAARIAPQDLFQELRELNTRIARQFVTEDRDMKILHFREALHLLKRLNQLEVTPPEYAASKELLADLNTRDLADFIARESRKSLVLSRAWEKNIRTASRFYELAHQRDLAVEDALKSFLADPEEKTAVLVYGGFHKANIRSLLQKLRVSYQVITPRITGPDPVHEEYYKQLMAVGVLDFEKPLLRPAGLAAGATRPPSAFVETFGEASILKIYQTVAAHPDAPLTLLEREMTALENSENRSELRRGEEDSAGSESSETLLQDWLRTAAPLWTRPGKGSVLAIPQTEKGFDPDPTRSWKIAKSLTKRLAEIHRSAFEGLSPKENNPQQWLKHLNDPSLRILVLVNSEGQIEGHLLSENWDTPSTALMLKEVAVTAEQMMKKKGSLLLDVFLSRVYSAAKAKQITWSSNFAYIPVYNRYLENRKIPFSFDGWNKFTVPIPSLGVFVESLSAGNVPQEDSRSEMRTEIPENETVLTQEREITLAPGEKIILSGFNPRHGSSALIEIHSAGVSPTRVIGGRVKAPRQEAEIRVSAPPHIAILRDSEWLEFLEENENRGEDIPRLGHWNQPALWALRDQLLARSFGRRFMSWRAFLPAGKKVILFDLQTQARIEIEIARINPQEHSADLQLRVLKQAHPSIPFSYTRRPSFARAELRSAVAENETQALQRLSEKAALEFGFPPDFTNFKLLTKSQNAEVDPGLTVYLVQREVILPSGTPSKHILLLGVNRDQELASAAWVLNLFPEKKRYQAGQTKSFIEKEGWMQRTISLAVKSGMIGEWYSDRDDNLSRNADEMYKRMRQDPDLSVNSVQGQYKVTLKNPSALQTASLPASPEENTDSRSELRSDLTERLEKILEWEDTVPFAPGIKGALYFLTDSSPAVQKEGLLAIAQLRPFDYKLDRAAQRLTASLENFTGISETASIAVIKQAEKINRELTDTQAEIAAFFERHSDRRTYAPGQRPILGAIVEEEDLPRPGVFTQDQFHELEDLLITQRRPVPEREELMELLTKIHSLDLDNNPFKQFIFTQVRKALQETPNHFSLLVRLDKFLIEENLARLWLEHLYAPEKLTAAFEEVKSAGVDISRRQFDERLYDVSLADPHFLDTLEKKKNEWKPFKVTLQKTRERSASLMDEKVLDTEWKRLERIRARTESLTWLNQEMRGLISLPDIYAQYKKEKTLPQKQPGEEAEVLDEAEMTKALLSDKALFYLAVLKAIPKEKISQGPFLMFVRNLLVGYALLNTDLAAQMEKGSLENRREAFGVLARDHAYHLLQMAGLERGDFPAVKNALQDLFKPFLDELSKSVVHETAGETTYWLVPQGVASIFRGRSNIIDCSFDRDLYKGRAFTRAVHEDTMYYFVYKGEVRPDRLKGYVGGLMGKEPATRRKVLTLDTINSPSLDGEELLQELFRNLQREAAEKGAAGIALPKNMQGAFNFDNQDTISKLPLYTEGQEIQVQPQNKTAWEKLTLMFGRDVYNSIEYGAFILLAPISGRSELRADAEALLEAHPKLKQISDAWDEFMALSEVDRNKFLNAYEGGAFVRSPFQWMDFIKTNWRLNSESRILDVGSGNGLAAMAFNILTGAEVTSIEVDPIRWVVLQHFLTFLKDQKGLEFPGVHFEQADFLQFPLEKFNLIYFYYTHSFKNRTFQGDLIAERLSTDLPEGAVFVSPGFYLEAEYSRVLIKKTDRRSYFEKTPLDYQEVRLPRGNPLEHTSEAVVLSRRSELRSDSGLNKVGVLLAPDLFIASPVFTKLLKFQEFFFNTVPDGTRQKTVAALLDGSQTFAPSVFSLFQSESTAKRASVVSGKPYNAATEYSDYSIIKTLASFLTTLLTGDEKMQIKLYHDWLSSKTGNYREISQGMASFSGILISASYLNHPDLEKIVLHEQFHLTLSAFLKPSRPNRAHAAKEKTLRAMLPRFLKTGGRPFIKGYFGRIPGYARSVEALEHGRESNFPEEFLVQLLYPSTPAPELREAYEKLRDKIRRVERENEDFRRGLEILRELQGSSDQKADEKLSLIASVKDRDITLWETLKVEKPKAPEKPSLFSAPFLRDLHLQSPSAFTEKLTRLLQDHFTRSGLQGGAISVGSMIILSLIDGASVNGTTLNTESLDFDRLSKEITGFFPVRSEMRSGGYEAPLEQLTADTEATFISLDSFRTARDAGYNFEIRVPVLKSAAAADTEDPMMNEPLWDYYLFSFDDAGNLFIRLDSDDVIPEGVAQTWVFSTEEMQPGNGVLIFDPRIYAANRAAIEEAKQELWTLQDPETDSFEHIQNAERMQQLEDHLDQLQGALFYLRFEHFGKQKEGFLISRAMREEKRGPFFLDYTQRSELRSSAQPEDLAGFNAQSPLWDFLTAFGIDPAQAKVESLEGPWGRVNAAQHAVLGLPPGEALNSAVLESAFALFDSREIRKRLAQKGRLEKDALKDLYLLTHEHKPAALVWAIPGDPFEPIFYYPLMGDAQSAFWGPAQTPAAQLQNDVEIFIRQFHKKDFGKTPALQGGLPLSVLRNGLPGGQLRTFEEGIAFPTVFSLNHATSKGLVAAADQLIRQGVLSIQGKTVSEIGTGAGWIGAQMALQGASEVHVYDLSLLKAANARATAKHYQVEDRVHAVRSQSAEVLPPSDLYLWNIPDFSAAARDLGAEETLDQSGSIDVNNRIQIESVQKVFQELRAKAPAGAAFLVRIHPWDESQFLEMLKTSGWELHPKADEIVQNPGRGGSFFLLRPALTGDAAVKRAAEDKLPANLKKNTRLLSAYRQISRELQPSGNHLPILVIEGMPGSGKSSRSKEIKTVLEGEGRRAVIIHSEQYLQQGRYNKPLGKLFGLLLRWILGQSNKELIAYAVSAFVKQETVDNWITQIRDLQDKNEGLGYLKINQNLEEDLLLNPDTVLIIEGTLSSALFESLPNVKKLFLDLPGSKIRQQFVQRTLKETGRGPVYAALKAWLLVPEMAVWFFRMLSKNFDFILKIQSEEKAVLITRSEMREEIARETVSTADELLDTLNRWKKRDLSLGKKDIGINSAAVYLGVQTMYTLDLPSLGLTDPRTWFDALRPGDSPFDLLRQHMPLELSLVRQSPEDGGIRYTVLIQPRTDQRSELRAYSESDENSKKDVKLEAISKILEENIVSAGFSEPEVIRLRDEKNDPGGFDQTVDHIMVLKVESPDTETAVKSGLDIVLYHTAHTAGTMLQVSYGARIQVWQRDGEGKLYTRHFLPERFHLDWSGEPAQVRDAESMAGLIWLSLSGMPLLTDWAVKSKILSGKRSELRDDSEEPLDESFVLSEKQMRDLLTSLDQLPPDQKAFQELRAFKEGLTLEKSPDTVYLKEAVRLYTAAVQQHNEGDYKSYSPRQLYENYKRGWYDLLNNIMSPVSMSLYMLSLTPDKEASPENNRTTEEILADNGRTLIALNFLTDQILNGPRADEIEALFTAASAGRSELRSGESETNRLFDPQPALTDLTPAEKELIRFSLKNGLHRQGAVDETQPLWLFGEQDVFAPFTAPLFPDSTTPSVDKSLWENKKVLVLPGYGNLPFILRLFGAREVVGIDADPVTIAWQKLKWKAGIQSITNWVFASENSRQMIQSVLRQTWFRSIDAPVDPDNTLDRLTFQTGDILNPIPLSGEKYDLIVIPYLFGFAHGLVSQTQWDTALENLEKVLSADGRILLFPGKLDLRKLTPSQEKNQTRDYQNWLNALNKKGWSVEHSPSYDFHNILGVLPVKAGFAVLSRKASERASESRSELRPSAVKKSLDDSLAEQKAALSRLSDKDAEKLPSTRSELRIPLQFNDPHWRTLVTAASRLEAFILTLNSDLDRMAALIRGESETTSASSDLKEIGATELMIWGEISKSLALKRTVQNLRAFLQAANLVETPAQARRMVRILSDRNILSNLTPLDFWAPHYPEIHSLLNQFNSSRQEIFSDTDEVNDVILPLIFPIEFLLEAVHDLARGYPPHSNNLDFLENWINTLEREDSPHNPSYNFARTLIRFFKSISRDSVDVEEINRLYGDLLRFEPEAGKRRWVREIAPVLKKVLEEKSLFDPAYQSDPIKELERTVDEILGFPSRLSRNEDVSRLIPVLKAKLLDLEQAVVEPSNSAKAAHAILDFSEALSASPPKTKIAQNALARVKENPQFGQNNPYMQQVLIPKMKELLSKRSELRSGTQVEMNFDEPLDVPGLSELIAKAPTIEELAKDPSRKIRRFPNGTYGDLYDAPFGHSPNYKILWQNGDLSLTHQVFDHAPNEIIYFSALKQGSLFSLQIESGKIKALYAYDPSRIRPFIFSPQAEGMLFRDEIIRLLKLEKPDVAAIRAAYARVEKDKAGLWENLQTMMTLDQFDTDLTGKAPTALAPEEAVLTARIHDMHHGIFWEQDLFQFTDGSWAFLDGKSGLVPNLDERFRSRAHISIHNHPMMAPEEKSGISRGDQSVFLKETSLKAEYVVADYGGAYKMTLAPAAPESELGEKSFEGLQKHVTLTGISRAWVHDTESGRWIKIEYLPEPVFQNLFADYGLKIFTDVSLDWKTLGETRRSELRSDETDPLDKQVPISFLGGSYSLRRIVKHLEVKEGHWAFGPFLYEELGDEDKRTVDAALTPETRERLAIFRFIEKAWDEEAHPAGEDAGVEKIRDRKNAQTLNALLADIFSISKRYDAYGVEGFHDFVQIAFEGKVRSPFRGSLTVDNQFASDTAGSHGVFYVLFKDSLADPDDRNNHLAYLVPEQSDKDAVSNLAQKGREAGLLTPEAAADIQKKLMTYQDFVNHHRPAVSGEVQPPSPPPAPSPEFEKPASSAALRAPKKPDELQYMRASLRHFLRRQLKGRNIDPKKYVFIADFLPYRILAARDSNGKILGFAFGKKGNRHMHYLDTQEGHEPDGFLHQKDERGVRIITYLSEGDKNYKEDEFVLGRYGDVYRLKVEVLGGKPSQQALEYHNWMPSYMLTKAQEVEALSKILGPQLYGGLRQFVPEDAKLILAPGMEPEARMTYWPSVQGAIRSREEVFGGLNHEGFDVAHIRRENGLQEQLSEGTPIRSLVKEKGLVQWTFEDNVQSTAIVLSDLVLPVGSKSTYSPKNPDDMGKVTIEPGGGIRFPEGVEYDVIDTPGEKYRVAFVYTHLALADWVQPGAEVQADDTRTIGTIERHRKYPYSPVVPHLHFAVMLFKESEIAKYPELNYEIMNRKLGPDKTILYVNPLSLFSAEQREELFLEGDQALPGFHSIALHALNRDALKTLRAQVGHHFVGIPVWTAVAPEQDTEAMRQSDLLIRQTDAGWIIEPSKTVRERLPDLDSQAYSEQDLVRKLQEIDFQLRQNPSAEKRSELRSVPASAEQKGTLLIDADKLASLEQPQIDELFSRLYMNRNSLRLVVFNENGQLPKSAGLRAVMKLPNVFRASGSDYEAEGQKYGFPGGSRVLFLKPGETFQPKSKLLKGVLLKKRAGEIEFARMLAFNGGALPNVTETNGVFDPPADFLSDLDQRILSTLVVAYSA